MKKFYTLLSLLALIGLANTPTMLYAQTSLIKGDIAFLELQGDTPDGFIFILLVDVETGTRINFSDIGYRISDGYAGANERGVVIWTATSNLSAGTVVKLTIDTPISATQGSFIETTITNAPGTSSLAIAGSGDQLVAWQDAGATAALPTSSNVIAAVNGASSDWGTLTNSNGSLDSNTSDLYGGLTDGVNAVTAGAGTGPQDEHDNIRFDPALFCSLNNKTKGQILVIVNDQDNWLPGPGATANTDPFPDYFTQVSGCTNNSVAVLPPSVVINEVLANPTTDANGDGGFDASEDEFIEIINNSGADLDVSGWTISVGTTVRHTFPANTVIPTNQAITVFGGGTPTAIAGVVQTASTAMLSLDNSEDDITIRNGTEIITTFNYGTVSATGESLARNPDLTGNFVRHTTITSNPVNFSPGANNADGALLPVELLTFIGKPIESKVSLQWQTATEFNNSHFEIERSSNGKAFKQIGQVKGNGTTLERQPYQFIDESPLAGMNYYRLKQLDFDGAYEYSEVVAVDMQQTKQLVRLQSNLVQDQLTILVAEKAELNIVNAMGVNVQQITIRGNSTIEVSNLAAGTYHLLVTVGGKTEVLRFVKL